MNGARTFLLVVMLIALATRLFFCIAVLGIDAQPKGDELDYHGIAVSLASGGGYSLDGVKTARRPPLYPVFLSFFYKLFGPRTEMARLIGVLLGVFIVYLTFKVADLYFSSPIARISAVLAAVNPFLIFISSYLLTENLYIVLLLVFLLAVDRCTFSAGMSPLFAVVTGSVLALASLARPHAFLLFPFTVLALVLHRGAPMGRRVGLVSVFLAALGLGITPWAARNRAVMGEWILFTTHGGTTFYQSNNVAVLSNKKYEGSVAPFYEIPGWDRLRKMDEATKSREAWKMGLEFLKNNKSQVPALAAKKFLRFWRLTSEKGRSGIKSGWWWNKDSFFGRLASNLDAGFIYAVFVLPLFVAGSVIALRSWRRIIPLYAIILVHTLMAIVFFGSLRGRLPLEPVIAVFASIGIYRAACRAKLIRSEMMVRTPGGD